MCRVTTTAAISSGQGLPTSSRGTRFAQALALWAPRAVGVLFLVSGFGKAADSAPLASVLAFDGFPQWAIPPLVWVIVLSEIVLGQAMVLGWGGVRTTLLAVGTLIVYTAQLGFLLTQADAPNCACLQLVQLYQSARESHIAGIVRNGILLLALGFSASYAFRQVSRVRTDQWESNAPVGEPR
jgi:uncharacterized membrane protein YphA (DoxX/SURF4 family)